MGDGAKLVAVGACAWLLLGQCQGDPVSAAKVAGTGAAVGVGAAGALAAGAAAKGAAQGLQVRTRDRVARPNGPSRPTPSTSIPPVVVAG